MPLEQAIIFELIFIPFFLMAVLLSWIIKNDWISIPLNMGLGFLIIFCADLTGVFSYGLVPYVQIFVTSLIILVRRITTEKPKKGD